MPKDEFDFEDPLELNGVGIVCSEDTTEAMTECFVEEFMRLGYNQKQILALFRNPYYLGMNMALEKRGEQFVKEKINEVFARWRRWFEQPEPDGAQSKSGVSCPASESSIAGQANTLTVSDSTAADNKAAAFDPMG